MVQWMKGDSRFGTGIRNLIAILLFLAIGSPSGKGGIGQDDLKSSDYRSLFR
jgi:hypothetical protein